MSIRGRLWLAIVATLATATLYAEGVLRDGLVEVAFVFPIIWFLAAPQFSTRLQNFLLSLSVICITIAVTDAALRPMIGSRLHATPMNVWTRKLPQLPIVGRWDPHIDFTGEAFGDLAAMAGDAGLRVTRRILFQTDEAGFRNGARTRPIDVLVLGDSFGAGSGTTQEKIMSGLLETRYGWSTYNLSFPSCGPWQQYINFAIESPRLSFAPQAYLVWLLYTGNDLDDEYGNTWNVEELPWKSGFSAWKVSYKTFRERSPLHQILDHLMWRFKRAREMAQNVVKRHLQDGRPALFLKRPEEWGKRTKDEVEHHPQFPKLVRTMQVMQKLSAEKGLKTIVVILPTKGEVYRWILDGRDPQPDDVRPSGFSEAVRSVCAGINLLCLDPKPYLIKEAERFIHSDGELLWWRDDTHLGERGHETVAAFIAQEIPTRDPRSQRDLAP